MHASVTMGKRRFGAYILRKYTIHVQQPRDDVEITSLNRDKAGLVRGNELTLSPAAALALHEMLGELLGRLRDRQSRLATYRPHQKEIVVPWKDEKLTIRDNFGRLSCDVSDTTQR